MSDPEKRNDDDETLTEEVEEAIEYFTKVGKDDSPTSDADAPPPG